MALLQKQNLDVRLLGLDEKANPRTNVAGTITDGRNWQMVKDGRIEKRPGLSAQAMLDTSAATITGARELSALGDELVMGDAKKWWARDAVTGAWIPRGRAAYERLSIFPATGRNAVCNGTDSCLQMDSAVIGRTQLTFYIEQNLDGTPSSGGWLLTDATTGQSTYALHYEATVTAAKFLGIHVDTDGHTASPTFVGFFADVAGDLYAMVWDNTAGFKTSAQVLLPSFTAEIYADYDVNTYGLQTAVVNSRPFAVQRVGDNVWLIAYHQVTTGNVVVRRVTRSSGTMFSVGSPNTVYAFNEAEAPTIAWAYVAGAGSAYVAAVFTHLGGGGSSSFVAYATVSASTGATSATGNTAPSSWNSGSNPDLCRGATGFVISGQPAFLFDAITYGGSSRSVWTWKPGDSDVTRFMRGCGLLTQAFVPPSGDADEIGVGIAYPSPWQASSFLLRSHWSGGVCSSKSIGAHLQAGDFAGRPMVQRLPNYGGVLALGVLTAPASLGGKGTASIAIATLPQDAHAAVSPPCEIADNLVIPGGILKSYDGAHLTEAAFPVGPERVTATQAATGIRYYLQANGSLSTVPPKALATLDITLATPTGTTTDLTTSGPASPVTSEFPAGNVIITLYAWLDTGSSPAAQVEIGQIQKISSVDGSLVNYNTAGSSYYTVTTTPTAFQITLPVATPLLTDAPNIGDLLRVKLYTPGQAGHIMHIQIGGPNASTVDTVFPVATSGVRAYVAVASWTDAKGRIQRSQVCQPSAMSSVKALAASVTVPMLSLTERDAAMNLDAGIQPVQIEVYRTQSNTSTFYRVFSVTNVFNGADVTTVDYSTDLDISANEQLYTEGAGVNHWPVIGCSLVAQHQGRIFVCDAANQVWFSAYAQSGEALAFAAEYQVETEHIRNRITALLSLDDKLVICTSTAYAALTGIGPEATGLPPYDAPMVVFSGIGPTSQRACARTPSGVVMVTAHGAHMFDRGLNLQYVGAQVEPSVPGSITWYTAAFHPQKNQVRLFGDSLATVYDWTVQPPAGRAAQFFKWSYTVTVVACAISSSQLYYLGSDGNVYLADVGYSDNGTAYQEWIQLSVLSPTGQNAWGRVYAARFTCQIASGTTLQLLLTPEEGNLSVTDTMTLAGPLTNVIAKPRYGKGSSMTMKLSENAATATAGITLDAIGLSVGTKGGLGRMPAGSRMVRS